MSLDKNILKAAIIVAQEKASQENTVQKAQIKLATELSNAIDNYVRAGVVTTSITSAGVGYSGFPVNSTGSGTGNVT